MNRASRGHGDRNLSRLLALLRQAPALPIPGGGTHLQQRFFPVPPTSVSAAARAYERLSRHRWISAEQLWRLAEDKAFSIEKAILDLGYAPRPFSVGIRAEAQTMGLAR